MNKIIITIILLLFHSTLNAQFNATLYDVIGKNNASEGGYIKAASIIQFNYKKTTIEGGIQADILSNNTRFISGYLLNASRSFLLSPLGVKIQPFWMYAPFGSLVFQRDMGILNTYSIKKWNLSIGIDFKNFGYTTYAIETYGLEKEHWYKFDNWNMLYNLNYFFWPLDSKYNFSISITDYDHFLINDSSNPSVLLCGRYSNPRWTFFAESSYMAAGFFNLTPTHYGYFVRTGVTCNLK